MYSKNYSLILETARFQLESEFERLGRNTMSLRKGIHTTQVTPIASQTQGKIARGTERSIPSNVVTLPQTAQLEALYTIIRDKNTLRGDFIFYTDRIIRLLVEEGLNHLPVIPRTVETPTVSALSDCQMDSTGVMTFTLRHATHSITTFEKQRFLKRAKFVRVLPTMASALKDEFVACRSCVREKYVILLFIILISLSNALHICCYRQWKLDSEKYVVACALAKSLSNEYDNLLSFIEAMITSVNPGRGDCPTKTFLCQGIVCNS